ncbi:MAG: hypothetical protein J0L66_15940 [Cytophagales bacterium]|nr:hypothetical protein [Cytophagales bacterium]
MRQLTKNALLAWVIIFSISCTNQSTRESNEIASTNTNDIEELTEDTIDFSGWNGTFFSRENGGIRLEGVGNTLKAFDIADETALEVELMADGKVIIDGAEAFVSNDTLRLVLNGSGGSHEVIYVREELNYVN